MTAACFFFNTDCRLLQFGFQMTRNHLGNPGQFSLHGFESIRSISVDESPSGPHCPGPLTSHTEELSITPVLNLLHYPTSPIPFYHHTSIFRWKPTDFIHDNIETQRRKQSLTPSHPRRIKKNPLSWQETAFAIFVILSHMLAYLQDKYFSLHQAACDECVRLWSGFGITRIYLG